MIATKVIKYYLNFYESIENTECRSQINFCEYSLNCYTFKAAL